MCAGHVLPQPRFQGFFPSLEAGREKDLASAGHGSILHPEILGGINWRGLHNQNTKIAMEEERCLCQVDLDLLLIVVTFRCFV